MRRLSIVLLAGLLAVAAPVRAQEDNNPLKCSRSALDSMVVQLRSHIGGMMGEAGPERDEAAIYADLVKLKRLLAVIDTTCLGLDFRGEHDMVTDPVFILPGIYRATAETVEDGWFSVEIIVLDGACYHSTSSWDYDLFGTAEDGDQSVLTSEGCLASFAVEYADEPFAVYFEKLK